MQKLNLCRIPFVILLFLTACAPSQSAVSTAIAQTQTAQPTSTPSITNDQYIEQTYPLIQEWTQSYSKVLKVADQAKQDRLLILSETWKADMLAALQELDTAAQKLGVQRDAPPDFQQTQTYLIKISEETRLLIEAWRQTFDGKETNSQIQQHNDTIMLYMGLVTDELKKYKSK